MRWNSLVVAVALAAAAPAAADSLWRDAAATSVADRKAGAVGDLVTILIVEDASGSHSATSQTSKENKFDASGTDGVGLFKFLKALGASDNTKNAFSGSGQAQMSSKLTAQVTARVIRVEPNGNLVIQGARSVTVNHDSEDLTLTATVRPSDIKGDNTVLSTYLADAVITSHGRGPNNSAQRQGFLSRVLNWIF